MSHFSVCVIVPDDGVVNNIHANNLEDHLIPVLAPFDEQTEEEKYREFEDRTEEAKADFENDTMRVVRFPDGSIHSIYDDAFNKSFFIEEDRIYAFGPNRDRKSKLQTEESKALELVTDYPVKAWYSSFEAYCDEHRGFVKASDGRWGYTYNPNAKWDWWQIGGRFPNRFLVPAGLQDCIPSAKDDDGVVGSEMCIRDSCRTAFLLRKTMMANLPLLLRGISMPMPHARRISVGMSCVRSLSIRSRNGIRSV